MIFLDEKELLSISPYVAEVGTQRILRSTYCETDKTVEEIHEY